MPRRVYRKRVAPRRAARASAPRRAAPRRGRQLRQLKSLPYAAQAAATVAGAAYNYATKSRVRTRTTSQSETEPSGSRQLISESRTYGRKPRATLYQAHKLLRNTTDHYVLRFSRINDMRSAQLDQASGALTLANMDYSANWGDGVIRAKYLPIHAYDITSCVNRKNGSIFSAFPGFELKREWDPATSAFANLSWRAIMARGPSGIDTKEWSYATTKDNSGFALPEARSIMDWFQLKVLMYGTRRMPTKYLIQLVQFKEGDVIPHIKDDPFAYDESHESLWQYMLKPCIYNPIADANPENRKKFKVLQTWVHSFQPDSSTNLDSAPPQKVFNLFKRMNRTCKWDWNAKAAASPANDQTDTYVQSMNENDVHVEPRARIFLVIRAMNTNLGAPYTGGTTYVPPPNTDYTPTYDIVLRTKHTFQN